MRDRLSQCPMIYRSQYGPIDEAGPETVVYMGQGFERSA